MDQAPKSALINKQQELRQQIATLENEVRESNQAEVEDSIDAVISTEAKAGALEVSTRDRQTLKEIDDALARLDEGTYGKCVDCGKPIEQARLAAVPWTRYCLADQEKHDRAQAAET